MARPGSAYQAASPVSHNDTGTPLAIPAAATVNAWLHRSGPSAPAVTLITKDLAIPRTLRPRARRAPRAGPLGCRAVGGMVSAGALVLILGLTAVGTALLVVRLSRLK
ncbi:hypothetical protein GCM10009678_71340 [Actinomadura kijaniata]